MCAGGFHVSELIPVLGAPPSLSALEQQQLCPCAAALPVSIVSLRRGGGTLGLGKAHSGLTDLRKQLTLESSVASAQGSRVPLE